MDNTGFADIAALARRLEQDPAVGRLLAEANPTGFEQVLKVSSFPLVRWQPFGYTIDDNPCQIGFCQSMGRQRWVTAGNRGGKTEMALMEDAADCLGIDVITKQRSQRFKPPIDVWVVSDTEATSIGIVQRTFAEQVLGRQSLSYGWEMVTDDTHYSPKGGFRNNFCGFTNGSRIDFKYSSAGRTAFQGTKIHKGHFDEVPPRDVYSELYARTIDREGQIIGTCTPIASRTHGIPWIFRDLYVPRAKKRIEFFSWSLFHNPHLPKDTRDALLAQWDADEVDARAYGMFTPTGMRLAFDRELLHTIRSQVARPWKVGWPVRDEHDKVILQVTQSMGEGRAGT
jgi:phage terminase large subunit-like protein